MTNFSVPGTPGMAGSAQQMQFFPYLASFSGTAAAVGTTAAIKTLISPLRFITASTGGETIKISASKDGTNYTDLTPIDESTGLPAASVNLASGTYRIPAKKAGAWVHFKFTKSAAVQAGSVAVGAALRRPPTGAWL